MNATLPGSGTHLADKPEVVWAWLLGMKPTLTALAGLGRAAVRKGTSNRDTMLLDFMRAMDAHSRDTLRWLGEWSCLAALVSPEAIAGLSDEDCRSRFQTLATLDVGL